MHLPSSINYIIQVWYYRTSFRISILYRSCFDPFSRGFIRVWTIPSPCRTRDIAYISFLFFFFLFLSTFSVYCVWNGSLVHGTFVTDRALTYTVVEIRPYKGCDLLTFMEYCSNNVLPFNVWQCGNIHLLEYSCLCIVLLFYAWHSWHWSLLDMEKCMYAYGAGKNNEKNNLTIVIFSTFVNTICII